MWRVHRRTRKDEDCTSSISGENKEQERPACGEVTKNRFWGKPRRYGLCASIGKEVYYRSQDISAPGDCSTGVAGMTIPDWRTTRSIGH